MINATGDEQVPQLPGEDLVKQGLRDLRSNQLTESALLVLIAAPRLRQLGIDVPGRTLPQSCEHELYERIEVRLGAGAHSYYNSLIRRIVSYARAMEAQMSRESLKAE